MLVGFVFAFLSLSLPAAEAAVLDGTVSTYLNRGETVSTSTELYLDPGETLHVAVHNYGPGKVYYKVYNSDTDKIVTSGYLAAGKSTKHPKKAPVGYYRIQLKCTTGATVHTNCDADGFLSDD